MNPYCAPGIILQICRYITNNTGQAPTLVVSELVVNNQIHPYWMVRSPLHKNEADGVFVGGQGRVLWCLIWSPREAGAVPCWLSSWGRSVQAEHWSVLSRLEKEPRNQGGKGEWVHEGVQKRGQEMRWEPGLGNVVHWGKDFYFCHSDLGSDGEFWVDLCLKESLETSGGEGLEEGSLVDLGQILDVFMESRVYRMCGWVWIREELCLDPRFPVWANGQMHLSSHANDSHICHIWH